MTTVKAYEREAFYVPLKQIPKAAREEILEDFTFRFYNEKACEDCEWRPERHSDVCDNCNEYKGGALLAKTVKLGEKKYMSFPIGNRPAMVKSLRNHGILKKKEEPKFINRQPLADDNEFRKPIKFKFKNLHDYQVEALQAMLEGKKGVLKSPPRTGKTVMSSALICTVGGKAMIMASQRDWLLGFYETFCGSDTQKPWTDASGSGADTEDQKWWRKSGRPRRRVGFCKTLEDFQKHDVCLVTYQTFINAKGRKLLKKVRDMFTTLVVDEVHTGAADKYAIVISSINAEYKIGLSGTPSRKDGRFVLMRNLMGPVLYESKVEVLQPVVQLTRTEFVYSQKQFQWPNMVTKLECDPKRLMLIAKTSIKDVKAGHMVLIPMVRVKAIKALVMTINRLRGKDIAEAFVGQGMTKNQRKDAVLNARKYKVKVLVGNSKLLSTGINIPRASAIYEVTPSSNKENAEQRVARILTPYEDKPPPLLRLFLDDMGVRRSCYRVEWWGTIWPKFRPKISAADNETWKNYLAGKDKGANKKMEL